ncbi:MAG: hypothetical protein NXI10_15765 [bacterium]|nr:hypothetical protein [bacterium]
MSETLDNTIEQQKRPTFLTVLCILTFIGSGWGIISALAFQEPLMKEYAGYYYWVMLLLNVGTLFGAIQMWQMKKIGLYIWTASEVISLILMWVVIKGFVAHLTGDVDTGDSNLDSLVSTAANEAVASTMNFALILGSIFPAAFIIMYWLNAKHLK